MDYTTLGFLRVNNTDYVKSMVENFRRKMEA